MHITEYGVRMRSIPTVVSSGDSGTCTDMGDAALARRRNPKKKKGERENTRVIISNWSFSYRYCDDGQLQA